MADETIPQLAQRFVDYSFGDENGTEDNAILQILKQFNEYEKKNNTDYNVYFLGLVTESCHKIDSQNADNRVARLMQEYPDDDLVAAIIKDEMSWTYEDDALGLWEQGAAYDYDLTFGKIVASIYDGMLNTGDSLLSDETDSSDIAAMAVAGGGLLIVSKHPLVAIGGLIVSGGTVLVDGGQSVYYYFTDNEGLCVENLRQMGEDGGMNTIGALTFTAGGSSLKFLRAGKNVDEAIVVVTEMADELDDAARLAAKAAELIAELLTLDVAAAVARLRSPTLDPRLARAVLSLVLESNPATRTLFTALYRVDDLDTLQTFSTPFLEALVGQNISFDKINMLEAIGHALLERAAQGEVIDWAKFYFLWDGFRIPTVLREAVILGIARAEMAGKIGAKNLRNWVLGIDAYVFLNFFRSAELYDYNMPALLAAIAKDPSILESQIIQSLIKAIGKNEAAYKAFQKMVEQSTLAPETKAAIR